MTAKTWKDVPRWKRVSVYVTGGLLAAVVALIAAAPEPAAKPVPEPELTREQLVKSQFSAWDGSHAATERAIKATLNDPDSYKHYDTRFWVRHDGSIKVVTQIGARNKFGGMVRGTFESIVSPAGAVVSLMQLD
jgi:hypothetical protein